MARVKEVDLSCGHKNCPVAYIHDNGDIYLQEVRLSKGKATHGDVMLSKTQLKKLYKEVFGK